MADRPPSDDRSEIARRHLDAYAHAAVPSFHLVPQVHQDVVAEVYDHLLCSFDVAVAAGSDPVDAALIAARSLGPIPSLRAHAIRRTAWGAIRLAARLPRSLGGLVALDFLGAASSFALEAGASFATKDDFLLYTLRASLVSMAWYGLAMLSIRLSWVFGRSITESRPTVLRPMLATMLALLGISVMFGHPGGLLAIQLMAGAAAHVSVAGWLAGWNVAAIGAAIGALSAALAWLRVLLVPPGTTH